jgi:hypothetical protein
MIALLSDSVHLFEEAGDLLFHRLGPRCHAFRGAKDLSRSGVSRSRGILNITSSAPPAAFAALDVILQMAMDCSSIAWALLKVLSSMLRIACRISSNDARHDSSSKSAFGFELIFRLVFLNRTPALPHSLQQRSSQLFLEDRHFQRNKPIRKFAQIRIPKPIPAVAVPMKTHLG